jgi:hypothetical protein
MKALIAAFSLVAAPAHAAPPPCIAPAEIEHATLFLIPPVFDGLAEQCRASLPAGAYLLTGGAELSKQLGAERTVHWNAAKSALVRLAGKEEAEAFGSDTIALLIRDTIRSEAAAKLKPVGCAAIDRGLALLAPLPPRNLAALVTLAAEIGFREEAAKKAKGNKKAGKAAALTLCPSAPPAPGAAL